MPDEGTFETWYHAAPKNFKFSVKANNAITHHSKFSNAQNLVDDFYKAARTLDDKLGCILWQLPPWYYYNDLNLSNILNSLNTEYSNAVEFRHRSWYNQDVYTAFKDNDIIFCGSDGLRMPDYFQPACNDTVYLRMHGNSSKTKNYTKTQLTQWAQKIVNSGAKTAYVYFGNLAQKAPGIENAMMLERTLKEIQGIAHKQEDEIPITGHSQSLIEDYFNKIPKIDIARQTSIPEFFNTVTDNDNIVDAGEKDLRLRASNKKASDPKGKIIAKRKGGVSLEDYIDKENEMEIETAESDIITPKNKPSSKSKKTIAPRTSKQSLKKVKI